jgi:GDPmannose 4,6-dehydratase
MSKVALITGITGQDGSYLCEYLLSKGYQVHGLIRRSSTFHNNRIDHLEENTPNSKNPLTLHYGDLADSSMLTNLFYEIQPEEVYNLAAQSHVRISFDTPEYTGDITGLGTVRLLEAIRKSGVKCRLYQASSSEMFGDSVPPQNEDTPFCPKSPYAVAKVYAYWMIRNYREGYGLYACNGILFNHESPRRGENFVSRKITKAVANILANRQKKLYLGNLDAYRDWGFAPEFVEGIWQILQQDKPQDFVLGTGQTNSVREFLNEAFGYVGLDWSNYVEFDSQYLRTIEVPKLKADITKAQEVINWRPRITFQDLVKIMVDADLEEIGLTSPGEGKKALQKNNFFWLKKP